MKKEKVTDSIDIIGNNPQISLITQIQIIH